MEPEKINVFCKWYTDLMAENMEFNGEPFTLGKTKRERLSDKPIELITELIVPG